MDAERILDGLNPEQRRAVEAVRGPVCILAGAGSGKTTTITRRIAHQVASGAFPPGQVLAVTFTDKAAAEMRGRLERLGVRGVRASTFHSAALAQLTHFRGGPPGRILASKALPLRRIGNALPGAFRFRPAADLATEIEWAKNRRIPPSRYLAELGDRTPPIPPDLMLRVYREYERRKEEAGYLDFEDLLDRTIRLFDEDESALAAVRDRYRAFTVDEYQDVNGLQQALLDRWLGPRDDLCAVGDDYQSIYAFTGASPEHLLALPRRFPHAAVVRLETNYRSTPQVLALANRLVPQLGGAEKTLRAAGGPGPEPELRAHATPADEAAAIVARVRALHADGVPLEEMAILYRTNARSADFEEALHAARIPFQGASLLAREGARQLLKALRRAPAGRVSDAVAAAAAAQGLVNPPPDGLGDRELTRQNDLARIVRVAEEWDDGTGDLAAFAAHLEERFGESAGGGVHLLTYHRAKGLEFDAVFLPRLEEKELPSRLSRTGAALAEERRLLYVGLTRARRHLSVSWSGKPSRFLAELGVGAAARGPSQRTKAAEPDDPLYRALKQWRLERAQADDLPAYVVFHNATLEEIARRTPRSLAELAAVPGVGPAKLERYGEDVLAALAATSPS